MVEKPTGNNYHKITDSAWVDSVSAEAVQELLPLARSRTVDRPQQPARLTEADMAVLENNLNFLGRAMRGFIVDFLRQTADRTTDLNYDSQSTAEEVQKKGAAGLFHATACAKGLMQRGLDINASTFVMGLCIRKAVDTFTERYNESEELLEKREPMASVLYREGQIVGALKKFAQQHQNSGMTPSP